MEKFFVAVLTDSMENYVCDGSCICECYGGTECDQKQLLVQIAIKITCSGPDHVSKVQQKRSRAILHGFFFAINSYIQKNIY